MELEISIIIPAYNSEKFIEETVTSALRQSLNSYEIIIGDDCSSDNTERISRQLADKHSLITYFRNERNLSEGGNRNRCIARAKGEFIFPLDHDNILPDGLLAKLLRVARAIHAKEGKHAMISPQIMQFFKDKLYGDVNWDFRRMRWIYHKLSYEDVLTCQQFCPSVSGHYLYHRSIYDAVGGYLEDVGSLDDLAFGIGTYVAGFRYVLAKNTFYYHRIHPGSMWVNESKNLSKNWQALFAHYGHYYSEGELLRFKQKKLNLK